MPHGNPKVFNPKFLRTDLLFIDGFLLINLKLYGGACFFNRVCVKIIL